jgi:CHAD domain-containing protein
MAPAAPPDPVVFSVGPELEATRIARWVPGTEPGGPVRSTDRTLLDTFDGRLRQRGMTLWRAGRRAPMSLRLEVAGSPALTVPLTAAEPDRLLAVDLPEGVVGDRLKSVIEERALLPWVRVRTRSQPLKVCNDDGKTVARMVVEEARVVARGGHEVGLGRRLEVSPVLGYGREMQRVLGALRRRLPAAAQTLADEALVAAGLPAKGHSSDVAVSLKADMRADRAMSAICRRLADVVDANRPGVLADLDPEFLHDLRVAVRRSRSVLKEMRGVLAPEEAAQARSDLRWIQEITGPTRDLDVLLHDWPTMAAPVPAAMAADLRPLVDLLERERQEAFDTMRRALRSRRFAAAWERWQAAISRSRFDGPDAGDPIGEMAGARIVAVYRGMVKMGSAVDDASPPAALHDLRKRGKELRYLLEMFGSMWPAERVKPLVGALKGLQDVLGHFQDDEIQVGELRSLGPKVAAAPGGTDSLIALGFVIEGLAARQHQAREDFARRFADFALPATRLVVDGTFR